jgi:hypothetical protein
MKRHILILLVLVLIVTVPAGCKGEEPQPDPGPKTEQTAEKSAKNIEQEIVLLYPDEYKNVLWPEFRKITVKEDISLVEMAETVLEELIKGPEGEFAIPLIDADTEILSLVLQGNNATVDFSKEFIKDGYTDNEKTLQVFSVVNTLSELGIEEVTILVEGKRITDHYISLGSGMSFIRNDEVMPTNK